MGCLAKDPSQHSHGTLVRCINDFPILCCLRMIPKWRSLGIAIVGFRLRRVRIFLRGHESSSSGRSIAKIICLLRIFLRRPVTIQRPRNIVRLELPAHVFVHLENHCLSTPMGPQIWQPWQMRMATFNLQSSRQVKPLTWPHFWLHGVHHQGLGRWNTASDWNPQCSLNPHSIFNRRRNMSFTHGYDM